LSELPIDPLDPVEYLVDRLIPWQVQLGCLLLFITVAALLYWWVA